jgi:hypothetical protein
MLGTGRPIIDVVYRVSQKDPEWILDHGHLTTADWELPLEAPQSSPPRRRANRDNYVTADSGEAGQGAE